MVFLKYFDVQKQTLFGVSKVYVQRTSKVGDLAGVICEKMRWAPQTPVKLYEVSVCTKSGPACLTELDVLGNQTRHDRAHEIEDDVCSE